MLLLQKWQLEGFDAVVGCGCAPSARLSLLSRIYSPQMPILMQSMQMETRR
jgi:hypothetical protein